MPVTPAVARRPALRAGMTALAAALLFGFSTPLVQRLGQGVGSFWTAALLYAGAALVGALLRQPVEAEARLHAGDGPRLVWMALAGAVVGPVALAWGLQHTSGSSASLMLSLEAVFTALLARIFYREALDRRVGLALALLTVGAMALVGDRTSVGVDQVLGLLAVLAATLAWGLDNTLSRPLAQRDPAQVVMAKGGLGAVAAAVLAWVGGESGPALGAAAGLLLVGGAGYGLSLRLYLLAQRSFGVARTGSVFAFAPFAGALLACAMGQGSGGLWSLAGAGLMVAGVLLHLAETHEHEHGHEELVHEHAHRHDDGHHDHPHARMPEGAHSHAHRHAALRHSHAHVPDAHHQHRH